MELNKVLNGSMVNFAGGVQLLAGDDTAVILPVTLSLISTLGLAGNLLVLLVLIRSSRTGRASEAHVLLANLSITDLLILALCAPLRVATYQRRIWTLGHFACRTAEWLQRSCLAVKSFTLAATSQARHNFAPNPSNDSTFKTRQVVFAVVTAWTVGLVFPIPDILFTRLQSHGNMSVCVSEIPHDFFDFMHVYSKILPLAAYAIPILFAAVCYIRTLLRTEPITHDAPNRAHQMEGSLMFLSVTAAHAMMLLPEWGSWVWKHHSQSPSCRPPAAVLIIAQVCVYLASALTPAIALTMVAPLRESLAWWRWLLYCRGSKHGAKAEGNSSAMRCIVTKALDDMECDAPLTMPRPCTDAFGRALPDLEHFWTERRNTTVAENHDPFPWERLDQNPPELSL